MRKLRSWFEGRKKPEPKVKRRLAQLFVEYNGTTLTWTTRDEFEGVSPMQPFMNFYKWYVCRPKSPHYLYRCDGSDFLIERPKVEQVSARVVFK